MKPPLAVGTLLAVTVALCATGAKQARAPQVAKSKASTREQAKSAVATSASKRKIACKTQENAALCYWTRGRLSFYAHRPPLRIWKIGTDRLLGVYSGPSNFPPRNTDQLELPELPVALSSVYDDLINWNAPDDLVDPDVYWSRDIFADLEVCPLGPQKKGLMQPVCIESAKNIFVRNE